MGRVLCFVCKQNLGYSISLIPTPFTPGPWKQAWCLCQTPSWLCSSLTPMSAMPWAPVSIRFGGASVKKWPRLWARRAFERCGSRSLRVRASLPCSVLEMARLPAGMDVHRACCPFPQPLGPFIKRIGIDGTRTQGLEGAKQVLCQRAMFLPCLKC